MAIATENVWKADLEGLARKKVSRVSVCTIEQKRVAGGAIGRYTKPKEGNSQETMYTVHG